MHTMQSKTGKKGFLAIKVDLEKAYDRIRLDFLKESLDDVGLPKVLIDSIINCITNASMQLLWNGELLDPF